MRVKVLEGMLREALKTQAQGDARKRERVQPVDELDRLTTKQMAVVLARIGGLTFARIASLMQVDDTTVKLHMKAALNHIGATSSEFGLEEFGKKVAQIPDQEFLQRFSLRKEWWIRPSQATLSALSKRRGTIPPPGGSKSQP